MCSIENVREVLAANPKLEEPYVIGKLLACIKAETEGGPIVDRAYKLIERFLQAHGVKDLGAVDRRTLSRLLKDEMVAEFRYLKDLPPNVCSEYKGRQGRGLSGR
jgi:hypothetical protein